MSLRENGVQMNDHKSNDEYSKKYCCLDLSREVGVKIVVDGSKTIEDHSESNHQREKEHF